LPQQQSEASWYIDVLNLYSGTAGSNLGGLTDILNQILRTIPQALEANAETYLQTG
jgi:hypothetical protein